MKRVKIVVAVLIVLGLIVPSIAMASGDKASDLVVVSDIRMIPDTGYYHSFVRYLADAYNAKIVVFATWCTFLTAAYGAFLGFFMDFLMSKTGLDLKSRKLIEH